MDSSPHIDPTSTSRLLQCLSLAIDETKLIRSIKSSTAMIKQLEAENPASHRLIFLKKEKSNLETRLAKTRSKASKMEVLTNLSKFR